MIDVYNQPPQSISSQPSVNPQSISDFRLCLTHPISQGAPAISLIIKQQITDRL